MRLAKVGEKAYLCDLAGFIGTAAPEVLAGMLRVLKHRGPDDEGVWVGLGIGRRMRHLSIIDLAGRHQPMSNKHDWLWIVCQENPPSPPLSPPPGGEGWDEGRRDFHGSW